MAVELAEAVIPSFSAPFLFVSVVAEAVIVIVDEGTGLVVEEFEFDGLLTRKLDI